MAPEDARRACAANQPTRLLEQYEAIAQASRQMAAAARDDHWDEFERLQGVCQRLINALKDAARHEDLDRASDMRRLQLLRGILASDADIRRCSQPALTQLDRWLGRYVSH